MLGNVGIANDLSDGTVQGTHEINHASFIFMLCVEGGTHADLIPRQDRQTHHGIVRSYFSGSMAGSSVLEQTDE